MSEATVSQAAVQPPGLPFLGFVYLLREYAIFAGMTQVLDLFKGLEKGLARDLDSLFLLARLIFVKRPDQLDRFERAFFKYFYDLELPRVAEGDPELIRTKEFRQWLEKAIQRGEIPRSALWSMSAQDLMKRFWDTVRQQMEAHHGGNRWVGTGGTSPFGHSGFSERGIRVFGQSGRRSAFKVMGDRRYVQYDSGNTLKGENMRQALGSLKRMVPVGAEDELDLDETIRKTCRNGGDIDLAFRRRELDRLKLVVLIDNGGSSMWPFVELTQLLFSKIKDRFKECLTYYFHNTIYDVVYKDSRRREALPLNRLLSLSRETRVFIVGDACMAPEELMAPFGSISFQHENAQPSIERLQAISERFPHAVWLNPVPREEWSTTHGAWTLSQIKGLFQMQDLTLRGIKQAVEYMRAGAA